MARSTARTRKQLISSRGPSQSDTGDPTACECQHHGNLLHQNGRRRRADCNGHAGESHCRGASTPNKHYGVGDASPVYCAPKHSVANKHFSGPVHIHPEAVDLEVATGVTKGAAYPSSGPLRKGRPSSLLSATDCSCKLKMVQLESCDFCVSHQQPVQASMRRSAGAG
jgi:hypothetical protein